MEKFANFMLKPIPAILGLLLLVLLNYLLFNFIADTNYFLWYLKNGSIISLSASLFTGLILKNMLGKTRLLSANPVVYLKGCADVIMTLLYAISDWFYSVYRHTDKKLIEMKNKRLEKSKPSEEPETSDLDIEHLTKIFKEFKEMVRKSEGPELSDLDFDLSFFWDVLISFVVLILFLIMAFIWVFVASPLNYLMTIFSGGLVRVAILGEAPTKKFSFSKYPFEVTLVINSLLIFIIKTIYSTTISG